LQTINISVIIKEKERKLYRLEVETSFEEPVVILKSDKAQYPDALFEAAEMFAHKQKGVTFFPFLIFTRIFIAILASTVVHNFRSGNRRRQIRRMDAGASACQGFKQKKIYFRKNITKIKKLKKIQNKINS
jgi:hypothetical protein